jgi:3-hydroxyacyl-CoA dehydrogenase
MSFVSILILDQIAVLEINSPPVNALSQQLRLELINGLQDVQKRADIKAIVLHCVGSTFICGADIKEFDGEPLEPHLPQLTALLENSPIVTIALLHGHVLGGGLEVAAACHYRLALDSTNIGLPEVTLGIVPGAGGCQRMMRLVGVENAVKLAGIGRAVKVTNAQYQAVSDVIFKPLNVTDKPADSLLKQSINWLNQQLGEQRLQIKKTAQLRYDSHAIDWSALQKEVQRSAKSNPVPQQLLAQLKRDVGLSVIEGEQKTRALFLSLRQSVVARALRHAFFTEKKLQARSGKTAFNIEQVAVIGAGTMGSAIAICFADAGFKVTLLEQSVQALDTGLDRIRTAYSNSLEKGRINQNQFDQRLSLIEGSCDYSSISEVDLVIEAAFESLEVKLSIFKVLDEVCKPTAILATNTSYLDINAIAQATKRPEAVVGLHFFSPANIMKLLEIVRADLTADNVLEQMQLLAKKLRKQAVTVGVCFGFAANRIYTRYGREVQQMLLEGASIELIDKAMLDFGMAMGPLAVQDLSGIDIGHNARSQYPQPQYDPGYFKVSAALVEAGRLGRKTKQGFYNYTTSPPCIDAQVNEIISSLAKELAVEQSEFDIQMIQQRAILAMTSEAMQVIKEGIVTEKEAIDLIWLHGYGFPRAKGGPIFMASELGVEKLQSEFASLRAALPTEQAMKIWPELAVKQYLL